MISQSIHLVAFAHWPTCSFLKPTTLGSSNFRICRIPISVSEKPKSVSARLGYENDVSRFSSSSEGKTADASKPPFSNIPQLSSNLKNIIQPTAFRAALLACLAVAASPLMPVAYAVPDSLPPTLFFDENSLVPKPTQATIQKSLTSLSKATDVNVHIILTRTVGPDGPQVVADDLWSQYSLSDNDVLVIASAKVARAGIHFGVEAARKGMTPEIAESIATETFQLNAAEEKYGNAILDVTNRLIPVLTGKEDPGPPQIVRDSAEGTFKSKADSVDGRKKYTVVVTALLVIAFVVPMIQYYWYVR